jgi:hypothetical protein
MAIIDRIVLLENYTKGCIAKDNFPTAEALLLESGLIESVRTLSRDSEGDVAERGFNVFWTRTPGTLRIGSTTYLGRDTAVDMQTQTVRLDSTYIGDCHTHPYVKKMGIGTHIGPSAGDYMEWWLYPPSSFRIALHFVVSESRIFLLLIRANTARVGISTKGANIDSAFMGIEEDTFALHGPKQRSLDDEKFNKEYAKAFEKKDYDAQRALYDKYFRGLGHRFSEANLRMNTALAEKLAFEYYVGDMDKTNPTCRLKLKSRPLHWSWFWIGVWEYNRHPTLM